MLSPSSASRGEAGAPRILAALEGRAPDAEAKHLPNKRRARPVRWVVLALLLALFAGAATWLVVEDGAVPLMAQAPASDPQAPGGAAANQVAPATNPDLIARAPAAPAADAASAPATAAIVDETPPAADPNLGRGDREPDGEPTNPLSVLAMTAPAPGVSTPGASAPGVSTPGAAAPGVSTPGASTPGASTPGASTPGASTPGASTPGPVAARPVAPGPTRQAAEQQRKQADNGARQTKPAKASPSRKPADSDAALLSALMDYGLPPASPPGTRVYKTDGMFMRVMPGSPLADRLSECRKLSFLEGEQCRLRTCAGHWGTAPECPTPQANIEP
ncbi:hypothetical protein CEK29_19030 [Bordetella genomosp. 5]|uniref:hypothetical protein n=1 Tax=Bordetella genomosp. 5 TaxID=1395608 RepID=UPI000B9E29E9|nr:hypothetical protein [Bordetella genomosp. 5]OZI39644.1 hypothetical protein CEK29_19030 [Bordetella genomosp. 5]